MKKPIAFNILQLLETPGIGVAKVNSIINWANNHKLNIESLFKDSQALREILTEKQIVYFESNQKKVIELSEKLEDKNITLLPITDDAYPERLRICLGKKAPPLLSVMGNKNLLYALSVGFCGSRKASEKGLATAHDCASQLSRNKINVISGYAAGVDMATHLAALKSNGTTSIVLAEGILHFKIKRDLKDIFDWERVAVISEFLPGITWSARNAMQRNRTICALSRAMVLIEAGSTGGSFEAGKACLDMGIPLFTPAYEGMPISAIGNRTLLNQGAHPLMKNRKKNMATIKPILSALAVEESKAASCYIGEKNQLTLFSKD